MVLLPPHSRERADGSLVRTRYDRPCQAHVGQDPCEVICRLPFIGGEHGAKIHLRVSGAIRRRVPQFVGQCSIGFRLPPREGAKWRLGGRPLVGRMAGQQVSEIPDRVPGGTR